MGGFSFNAPISVFEIYIYIFLFTFVRTGKTSLLFVFHELHFINPSHFTNAKTPRLRIYALGPSISSKLFAARC
jgi:hypothetical protein